MDVTGSPFPIVISGKEYFASPLTDGDIVELDHWIQSQYIARVRESLPEDVSEVDYDRAMTLAYKTSLTLSWTEGDGAVMMASVDGVSRIFWHQLRGRHPELKHADVRKMVLDPMNLRIAQETFKRLNLDPVIEELSETVEKGGPDHDQPSPPESKST